MFGSVTKGSDWSAFNLPARDRSALLTHRIRYSRARLWQYLTQSVLASYDLDMATRETMNVSLPPEQEQFVRSQVATGRYRSASEVMREGLRMLEAAEHKRLLEKWLYDDLSEAEKASLPPELIDKARAHFDALLTEAREDVKAGRVRNNELARSSIRTKKPICEA